VNFLAHFHLAWPDEGLIAGALEGDFYKGPINAALAPGLARGIRLHRAIDAFTDGHPLVGELRSRFPASLRRYAGILIDLSFDHYLTRHWPRYCSLELREFNAGVHRALTSQEDSLTEGCRLMLERLRQHDILNRYHDWNMVTASARRIGDRFSRGNPLLSVERDLRPLQGMLETTFLAFYPELRAFSADLEARIALSREST
jgi:acyl carrier protein phosphodiesterase